MQQHDKPSIDQLYSALKEGISHATVNAYFKKVSQAYNDKSMTHYAAVDAFRRGYNVVKDRYVHYIDFSYIRFGIDHGLLNEYTDDINAKCYWYATRGQYLYDPDIPPSLKDIQAMHNSHIHRECFTSIDPEVWVKWLSHPQYSFRMRTIDRIAEHAATGHLRDVSVPYETYRLLPDMRVENEIGFITAFRNPMPIVSTIKKIEEDPSRMDIFVMLLQAAKNTPIDGLVQEGIIYAELYRRSIYQHWNPGKELAPLMDWSLMDPNIVTKAETLFSMVQHDDPNTTYQNLYEMLNAAAKPSMAIPLEEGASPSR